MEAGESKAMATFNDFVLSIRIHEFRLEDPMETKLAFEDKRQVYLVSSRASKEDQKSAT